MTHRFYPKKKTDFEESEASSDEQRYESGMGSYRKGREFICNWLLSGLGPKHWPNVLTFAIGQVRTEIQWTQIKNA